MYIFILIKNIVLIIYIGFRSFGEIFIFLFNDFLCLRKYFNINVSDIS